jgi:hypothetical protein
MFFAYFKMGNAMTSTSLLTGLLQDYQSNASPVSAITAASGAVSASSISATKANDGYGDAYILDLSQAAQDILDNQRTGKVSIVSLSATQTQKLQSILDKYKDAPINSDTLSALNKELEAAGLSPEELAATQEAASFDSKAAIINGLFGTPSSATATDGGFSGLSSAATGTPIGDLLQQYVTAAQNAEQSSEQSS